MRITFDQARLIELAIESVNPRRVNNEMYAQPWIDLEQLDGTGIHLLVVRFPGNCMLSKQSIERRREDDPEFDSEYATGVFVIVLDEDGSVVFARHTGAGVIAMRDNLALEPEYA